MTIEGAFADNNNLFEVWVMVGAGVVGYLMRRLDYDPAPLVLGLVLGPLMERSLVQALTIGHGAPSALWSSPLAAGLLLAAAGAAIAPALASRLTCRARCPGDGSSCRPPGAGSGS